jgi:hypothetical protein
MNPIHGKTSLLPMFWKTTEAVTDDRVRTKLLIKQSDLFPGIQGMNQRTKVAITVVIVSGAVAFFLFAPVVYWFSYGPAFFMPNPPHWNMYGSLGCVTIGWGDIYSVQGLQLSCRSPPIPI